MKEFFRGIWNQMEKPKKEEVLPPTPKPDVIVTTDQITAKRGYVSSIEAWKMPVEGRSLAEYENQLNFNAADLEGAIILDMGAGPKDRLATDLKKQGVAARVVALSPDYSKRIYAERVREASPEGEHVAGLGQSLPFADETFDRALALHVYEWILSKEIFLNMLSEMARTLKRGGVARLGPVQDIPHGDSPFEIATSDSDLTRKLEMHHVTLEREDMPESQFPTVKVKNPYEESHYVLSYVLVLKKAK